MKIPETSANVGAYYGNSEENGQWQPNGMIIDSGVGGGVVGSGDAGAHRAPYPAHAARAHPPGGVYAVRRGRHPVHMPRPHIPAGYVMAGPYYPAGPYPPPGAAPGAPDDFADYMWMENEEEFDKQVMQQLEEEALMEQCIEAMLEDEQREQRQRPAHNGHHYPTTSNGGPSLSIEETLSRSTLNPLAAEFVPTRGAPPGTPPHTAAEDKQQQAQPPAEAAPAPQPERAREESPARGEAPTPPVAEDRPQETAEPPATQPEPPEVSAAGVLPDVSPRRAPRADSRDARHASEHRTQTTDKVEFKKSKPQVMKSETKVQPKKKEVRSAKSEARVEERVSETALAATEVVKPQLPQPTPVEEPASTGPKPINYAAAARANKPKKPTTPPVLERTPPPVKVSEKKTVKTDKPIQRKNSTK